MQIRRAIDELAEDPRPRGAAKMRGTGSLEDWRIWIGDYRVVYRVDDEAREVLILTVGHRFGEARAAENAEKPM